MKRIAKFASAALAAGLLSMTLVACGGGQESSSSAASESASSQAVSVQASSAASSDASASASAQASTTASKDELIAELKAAMAKDDFKSATMTVKGDVKLEAGALEDPSQAEDASTPLDIATNMTVKVDEEGGSARLYLKADIADQSIEAFLSGSDVVVVSNGQTTTSSLEDVGLGDYDSLDSIIKAQGGDVDRIADSIESISKSEEGSATVYTVTCDPDKFVQANGDVKALDAARDNMKLSEVGLVYRIGKDGRLASMDITMSSSAFSSDMTVTMSDYDATVVPTAPTGDAAGAAAAGAAAAVGVAGDEGEDEEVVDDEGYDESDEESDGEDEYVDEEGEEEDEYVEDEYVEDDGSEDEYVDEGDGSYEESYDESEGDESEGE